VNELERLLCSISTIQSFIFCKFLNDNQSDFVNTYNSFGFYVDLTDAPPKITTNGSFTAGEALKVWDQIENTDKPIASTFFNI
jgi:hypothetical protein